MSRLPLSCTVPRAWPPERHEVRTWCRAVCPVTASSSESKPIRLSATRVNSIRPVCGAAQPSVPDAGRGRALPLGVRGIDLDDAVAAPAAGEDAVDHPLAQPASGERQLHLAFGRAQGVDARR